MPAEDIGIEAARQHLPFLPKTDKQKVVRIA
jgi:hypothetical protein